MHNAAEYGHDLWSEGHQQELNKVRKKRHEFLLDAVSKNLVPEDQVDMCLLAEAKEWSSKRWDNDVKALLQGRGLPRPVIEIDPSKVQICDEGEATDTNADFFVVNSLDDPSAPLLHAALFGKTICNPQYIISDGKEGTAMKFRPAIQTKRQIWISSSFREQCGDAATAIDHAVCHSHGKWKYMEEMTFLEKMVNGPLKGYGIIGLVSDRMKEDREGCFFSISNLCDCCS